MAAVLPADEATRLARLRALAVLDTEAEPLFDALAGAAAAMAQTPMALITLVDAERQWFKANVGLAGVRATPRDVAFCAHTILGDDVLEVADARADPRFADSALVTGKPFVRFYAGAPIIMQDGARVGSLCVMDGAPHTLTAAQRAMLKALAAAVAQALDLRVLSHQRIAELEHRAAQTQQRVDELLRHEAESRDSGALLDRTGRLAGLGGWELDIATRHLAWADETHRLHEVPAGYEPTLEEMFRFYAPEVRPRLQAAVQKAIETGAGWDMDLPLVTATGRRIWVHSIASVEAGADGRPRKLIGALQDITLRKRAVSALETSERRYRKLFQYSLGPICTHDHEGVLLSVNPAAAHSLGYSVGELLGRSLTELILPDRQAAFQAYLLRMMRNDRDSGILQLRAKDGSLRTWQYQNMLDDDSDEPYVLAHAQDITERYQQEQELQRLSSRDPLTGCYNRRFLAGLESLPGIASWGCVIVDLDHFKQVNDTYGHQRGDEVLVAMAKFLTAHTRPQDAVVRLGGDEFLLLLRDADLAATRLIADRLEADRAAAPIGFTLGVAVFDREGSLEQAMAEADRRLYEARKAVRGGG